MRSPEEEALIDALVAGELGGLIAVCPTCERTGRLVVISDDLGPFDACCEECAAAPLLSLDWLYEAIAAELRRAD